jgi:tetratricopeptide (TPR) repeat protein
MEGNFEKAIDEINKVLEQDPENGLAQWRLAVTYENMGRFEEAVEVHEKIPGVWWSLARLYAKVGREDEARQIIAKLEQKPDPLRAYGIAAVYANLGEMDKAFQWLAYRPHHAWLPAVRISFWFFPLRDDPRFHELLREMNLPPVE